MPKDLRPAVLFVHASAVSLAATQRGLERLVNPPVVRNALETALVDPHAMRFAQDEAGYARLRAAVVPHLHDGAEHVILSCSVYNGYAERLETELGLPVQRSDEAGARSAIDLGLRIGLAVSYPPSYQIIEGYLLRLAAERRLRTELVPLLAENAFAFADDAERYGQVLTEAARRARETESVDALFLAQFSMDPYLEPVARAAQLPVVSALTACLQSISSLADR
jgi:aspartate/glutamate racemase